jgi:hypothetical protein
MLIVLHVTIALLSLVQATSALFVPTRRKLHVSYGLLAGTLLSGTYLVIVSHASLLSACASGLLYTVVVLGLIAIANRRLAAEITR